MSYNPALILSIIFLSILTCKSAAQQTIIPVADYTFETGTAKDNTGNTSLSLRKGAVITEDSQRGKILKFSAGEKSYAVFSKQLLKDTCTISFYFYWEDAGATDWHQLFETYNFKDRSNFYLCPSNGWDKKYSLFSDSRIYDSFEGVYGQALQKNTWTHLAVTIRDKEVKIYVNGQLSGSSFVMMNPGIIKGDSLFLAGNPYRSDNYYITARYDDIKIFDQALYPNQIQALSKGFTIPAAEENSTSWNVTGKSVDITIDLNDTRQTIRNFGASDGWNTEAIGKYWPLEKKEKLAGLLFSTEKDSEGNPKGIGLSSWRFNIGAGTSEQGDASRISMPSRRTEGFLNSDGTYNWNKQAGQQWFLNAAAKKYAVKDIIGWQNSPPVLFTSNNLGFREYGAPMSTILKSGYYDDFAKFLADVVEHFKNEGIIFNYISPLNEPQWGWAPSSSGGTVTQEGTPWTNQNIYDVASAIDNEFGNRGIDTKCFFTEAGSLNSVTGGTGHADNQLYSFWNPQSSLSLLNKKSVAKIMSYHSYFDDNGYNLVNDRQQLQTKIKALGIQPEAWQTEYSLLGDGYRQGYASGYKLTEMETALALARVIVTDLNVANVSAWQWWTAFEKGKSGGESRYCLIEAFTDKTNTDGIYHLNKLFYGYGNFSHFIRPDMKRVGFSRSDLLNDQNAITDLMFTTFVNEQKGKLVIVAINHTRETCIASLKLINNSGKEIRNISLFLTDDFNNLKKQDRSFSPENCILPARSIVTITADLESSNGETETKLPAKNIQAFYQESTENIIVMTPENSDFRLIEVFSVQGSLLYSKKLISGQTQVIIPAVLFPAGMYQIKATGAKLESTKKLIIYR